MPTTPAALPAFFMPTADVPRRQHTQTPLPAPLAVRRVSTTASHIPFPRFYPLPRPTLPDHFGAITVIVECENDSSAYGLVK